MGGLAVLVAAAIPTIAGAGHQTGSVTSYTGCLKVSGDDSVGTIKQPSGAFLFADSTGADFNSIVADEFAVRASGGFRFRTDSTNTNGCKPTI